MLHTCIVYDPLNKVFIMLEKINPRFFGMLQSLFKAAVTKSPYFSYMLQWIFYIVYSKLGKPQENVIAFDFPVFYHQDIHINYLTVTYLYFFYMHTGKKYLKANLNITYSDKKYQTHVDRSSIVSNKLFA